MDLIQESLIGMTIAAKKWNPGKGTRFGTYAIYWMRAYITKFLMINSSLIHIGNTKAGRKVYFYLPKIKKKLNSKGLEPNCDIVANNINENKREISRIISRINEKEISLSTYIDKNKKIIFQDLILDNESINPENNFFFYNNRILLKKIIINFELTINNSRDYDLWKNHLISFYPVSLVNIGIFYNISKQRINQLLNNIKKSFKRFVKKNLGINYKSEIEF